MLPQVYAQRARSTRVGVGVGARHATQTPPTLTLLVKSQICRKQLGHAIFETQKDRDLAPVKRALAPVEILLPRLNQQSLF
jgi:hypothetical protein